MHWSLMSWNWFWKNVEKTRGLVRITRRIPSARACRVVCPTREMYAIKMTFTIVGLTFCVPRGTINSPDRYVTSFMFP